MAAVSVGTRVELVRDVDRFPHFIAPKGAQGEVVYADEHTISVRMDELVPGAEEWDNEVCWYPSNDVPIGPDVIVVDNVVDIFDGTATGWGYSKKV